MGEIYDSIKRILLKEPDYYSEILDLIADLKKDGVELETILEKLYELKEKGGE